MLSDFRNTEKPTEYHDDAVLFTQKDEKYWIYPHTHKPFIQEMQRYIDINDELIQSGGMDKEFIQKQNECIGEYLIKKWKNVTFNPDYFREDFPEINTEDFKKDDEGNFIVPFNKKVAKLLMTHKHYKNFQNWVHRMAWKRGNYAVEKEAEDVKNS